MRKLMRSAVLRASAAVQKSLKWLSARSLVFGGGKTARRHQSAAKNQARLRTRDSFCTHSSELNQQKFLRTDGAARKEVCLLHTRAAVTAQLDREQSEGCCCEQQDAPSPRPAAAT